MCHKIHMLNLYEGRGGGREGEGRGKGGGREGEGRGRGGGGEDFSLVNGQQTLTSTTTKNTHLRPFSPTVREKFCPKKHDQHQQQEPG